MRLRKLLPLAVIAAMLAVAAPASANFRVGLSEQNPAMFDQPLWQQLHLKRVRYILPWDWYKHSGQNAEVVFFMQRAHLANQEVLATFTAPRACYLNGRYSKKKSCRAPSTSAYKSAVKRFEKAYPWVRTYIPWNEANHLSQPTAKSPKKAAQYYLALKSTCKSCTVLAADVLDQTGVASYLRSFLHYSHGKGRIWGLHNYSDVNRHRSSGTAQVLKIVPGEVWLTETGGVVTFLNAFKTSQTRAAKATKYMFGLAGQYSVKRHGMRSKITRLYVYRWYGEKKGARFDAGLVDVNGRPRKAFSQFKAGLKGRLR